MRRRLSGWASAPKVPQDLADGQPGRQRQPTQRVGGRQLAGAHDEAGQRRRGGGVGVERAPVEREDRQLEAEAHHHQRRARQHQRAATDLCGRRERE
jgi:hypothetical protein